MRTAERAASTVVRRMGDQRRYSYCLHKLVAGTVACYWRALCSITIPGVQALDGAPTAGYYSWPNRSCCCRPSGSSRRSREERALGVGSGRTTGQTPRTSCRRSACRRESHPRRWSREALAPKTYSCRRDTRAGSPSTPPRPLRSARAPRGPTSCRISVSARGAAGCTFAQRALVVRVSRVAEAVVVAVKGVTAAVGAVVEVAAGRVGLEATAATPGGLGRTA